MRMSDKNKDVCIKTKIVSHHHLLTADAFEYFQHPDLLLEVSDVMESSFILSCYKAVDESSNDLFYYSAHNIISNFLIAINVATMGHFTWDFKFVAPVPYLIVDNQKKKRDFLYAETSKYINKENPRDIDKKLIWRTMQLFLAIAKDKDRNLKKEYIKGLYNLHTSYFDIEFLNEAFGNFYKAFEFFCTTRFLKVKKLSNEKKRMREVLSDFGFDEPVLKDFDKIYLIRCNQAMHAQKNIESVDKEAVIRIKIFLDAIMHKYYQPIWEQILDRSK